jgi:very-short-patch-repair endonuclease
MKKYDIIKLARNLRKDQTKEEELLWCNLRNRKFYNLKFNRQHPISYFDSNSKRFFIADFYCAEKSLVIELDGKIHSFQKSYDKFRDEILNKKGIKVLHIKNEEIIDIPLVLKKIKNEVKI